jgi:catechol 2,3-dioxygenase-like lactoylglutathione lyase family enzyme
MAKIIFGNHAAVVVPRQDRDEVRGFYCDVLGFRITRQGDCKDDFQLGEGNYFYLSILGLHTAADVHHGRAAAVRADRALVLTDAYRAHPERFVRKPPAPPKLPVGSWINPPNDNPEDKEADAQ